MHAIDTFETVQPKESNNLKGGCTPDNNIGSGLDLLKEGQTMKASGQFQPAGVEKTNSAYIPDFSLDDAHIMKWGGIHIKPPHIDIKPPHIDIPIHLPPAHLPDVRLPNIHFPGEGGSWEHWPTHWKGEVEKAIKVLEPGNILSAIKELGVVSAAYPVIAADVTVVIAGSGTNIPADIKLGIDLLATYEGMKEVNGHEDIKNALNDVLTKLGISH